jgi:hypothetical protein
MAKLKSILTSERYKKFCVRYRHDLVRYAHEIGMSPTWQQMQLMREIQKPGCRVAVASGHGTGKSRLYALIADWKLRVYPLSNTLITATNVEQIRSVIWKELDDLVHVINRRFSWMAPYFIKETKRYYARGFKDSWFVIPKTAPKHTPEAIAGQHRKWYTVLVDEASGVDDEVLQVIRGGLTNKENRFVMVSQPTRLSGHFAEAFSTLKGIYKTFQLNAELSPLVSKEFIREKLQEYGGHHSPEYQIRVLGNFPDNLSGFLIPKSWCEAAQKIVIEFTEDWGWVMTCDVSEGVGRDSSVMNLAKVSGYGDDRLVEAVETVELPSNIDPKVFGRIIYQKSLDYPGITVGIDCDGPGLTTVLEAEELGVNVVRIHWGRPPHSESHKKRYQDQRAYASVEARKAIFDNRMKLCPGKKVVEQASKIPYSLDRRGRYVIMPKDQMRTKGIKSPDIFDTFCFFFLVDYTPVSDYQGLDSIRDERLKWAQEILEGEAA